jgi:hypothetical protein
MEYPKLEAHPRSGTPAPDRATRSNTPLEEPFEPQEIGVEHTPGCFVCGGQPDVHSRLLGHVRGPEAARRIVEEMFAGRGAWVDYRYVAPDVVAVEIGACADHEARLERLMAETRRDRTISAALIDRIRRGDA